VSEAGFSIVRFRTYVRVYLCVCVTTLQHCGGIRALQALLLWYCLILLLSWTTY